MSKKFKVLIDNGSSAEKQAIDVAQAAGAAGKPVRIKAHRGERFKFEEINEGQVIAPENVLAKRVGKNLEVTFEGGTNPDLIIEDYYDDNVFVADTSAIYGEAESGALYEYIPQDPAMSGVVSALADGGTPVAMALGGGAVGESFALAALPVAAAISPLAAGLGALGVAALAGGGSTTAAPVQSDPSLAKNLEISKLTNDTGVVGDWLTTDQNLVIGGTVTNLSRGNFLRVELRELSSARTILAQANAKIINATTGEWEFDIQGLTLPAGSYYINAFVTDNAGNPIGQPTVHDLFIQPNTPAVAPDMTAATDSGSSSTDNNTNFKQPDFNIGVLPAGQGTPKLLIDGVLVDTKVTTAPNGDTILTPVKNVSDGPHTVAYQLVVSDTNKSDPSPALPFTVDTTAPSNVNGQLDQNAASDSGNIGDNRTTVTTPFISGSKIESGAKVSVLIDGKTYTTTALADGTYSVQVTNPLKVGSYTPKITVTDGAGNASLVTDGTAFIVESSAPNTPTNTPDMTATSDSGKSDTDNITKVVTPGFNVGPIASGLTPKLIIDGKEVPSTPTTDNAGNTILTPTGIIPDGQHTVAYKLVTTADGKEGGASPALPIIVDTTPPAESIGQLNPALPDDTGLLKDNITSKTTPTIVGTAEPGATVKLEIVTPNGTLTFTTTADPTSGLYSIPVTTPLADGTYTPIITVTDLAGNARPKNGTAFTVDSTPPPVINDFIIEDDFGDKKGPINSGDVTDDRQPKISGSVVNPDTKFVVIFDANSPIGSAAVINGKWEFTPTSNIATGAHAWSVAAVDAAGNQSAQSAARNFSIITGAPTAPSITEILDNVEGITGPIASGGVTNDEIPRVKGTGQNGNVIRIFDNGVEIGSTTVVGTDWFADVRLQPGIAHNITAKAVDAAGQVSEPTGGYPFSLDTTAPTVPVVTNYTDDAGDIKNNFGANTTTDDELPVINGTAEIGSKVEVFIDGKSIGTVTATTGSWSVPVSTKLLNGLHTVTVTSTDGAGNSASSNQDFKFTVDATAVVITIDRAIDNVDTVTSLATGALTNDATPELQGTAPTGSVVVITEGARILGSVTATDGTWSFTPSSRESEGTHNYTATTTSAAGNKATANFGLIIDTVRPDLPVITAVVDDVGSVKPSPSLANGDTTDDTTPTIKGTGEIGSTISLYDGDSTAPFATNILVTRDANGQGVWSYTPSPTAKNEFTEGLHTIRATSTDGAGNTTLKSAPFAIIVDVSAPSSPGLDIVTDADKNKFLNADELTGKQAVTVKVTVPAGAGLGDTLQLTTPAGIQTRVIQQSDIDNGWTTTVAIPAEGTKLNLSVVAIDKAGNSSLSTAAEATVDTTPPDPRATTILLNAVATDNVVNATEATGPVEISGVVSGNFAVGQKVSLVINGQPAVEATILSGGIFRTTVSGASLAAAGSRSVVASLREFDGAGNGQTYTDTKNYTVDTVAPNTPKVELLTDANNDGLLSAAELNGGNTVAVKISLPSGTVAGDTIVVVGGNVPSITITQADITAGYVTTTAPKPTEGSTLNVTATLVDGSGNRGASDTDSARVDTTAPSPLVVTRIADDVGTPQDDVTNGSTDDNRPTIIGTVSTDAKYVNIYETIPGVTDPVLIGSATVNATTGEWSFTPPYGIATGSHTWTAKAVDGAGNVSDAPAARTFNVVTDAPTTAAITSVVDNKLGNVGPIDKNGATNDETPTVTGTAPAGSVVTIYDGATPVTSVTTGANGVWSVDVPLSGPSQGNHPLTAQATLNGVSTPKTDIYNIILDTVAAATPSIDSFVDNIGSSLNPALASGSTTDDARPEINGTGEAGTTVEVFLGTKSLGTAVVGNNNKWTLALAEDLPSGLNRFTATAVDKAGNTSARSPEATLTVEGGNAVVTIDNAVDNQADIIGNVLNGGVTNDTTPKLEGRAPANAVVTITDTVNGTTTTSSVTADNSGKWTFTPATSANGTHSYTATATNAAGNPGSASYSLVIDSAAPDKPSINFVADDVGSITGDVANGGRTDDTTPTIKGRAEPLSTVTLRDNTNTVIGTAQADSNGDWSFTPVATLGQGLHSITVTATDKAGNTSIPSDARSFTVDTVGPSPVGPSDDPTNPPAGKTSIKLDPIAGNDQLDATEVNQNIVISGRVFGEFQVGNTVTLNVNGNFITTDVKAGGAFSISVAGTQLAADTDKKITASVQATDLAGNPGTIATERTYTSDTVVPNTPTVELLTDANNDRLLSAAELNNGTTVAVKISLPSGTVAGDRIEVLGGNVPSITLTQADINAGYVTTTATKPAEGTVLTVTATIVDAIGNRGASGSDSATVDTTAPGGLAISRIADDFGVAQFDVANGTTTDDNRPEIIGTVATDAKYVNVYDTFGGAKTLLGTATVTGGNWSFTPTAGLANGQHVIVVTAVDTAGNVSPETTPVRTFTIVTDAPATAAITSVIDNTDPVVGPIAKDGTTNDKTPTITGTAPAGSLVKIYDGTSPNPIASVITGSNGVWTVDAPIDTQGNHPLTAEATLNGVTTPRTDAYNIILDTVAPTKPVITDFFDSVGSSTGSVAFGTGNVPTTDDARPEINGTGEIGSTIEVFGSDGKSLGTTTVVANPGNPNQGVWVLALSKDLPAGLNSFTAKATDKAGNTSVPSDAVSLTLDTSNVVVTIDDAIDNQDAITGTILNGGVTNDKTPMLEGRAPANTLVTISEGGVPIGSATSDNSGKWTFTPTNAAEGPHTYTASATNAAGNQGTAKFSLVVDTAAPAITIDSVNDDVGAVTGVVAEGARIDDTTPTIRGRAEAFSIVTVTDLTTNKVLGTVQTGSDGNWSITPTASLAQGLHKVSATATDASGNTGTATKQPSFIIDTTAPNTPTVEVLTDANNDGFLNAAELNNGTTVAVKISLPSGTLAGDKIEVVGGNVPSITLTQADIDAGYVTTTATKPAEGTLLTVTATIADGAGNRGASGSDSATVDTTAPSTVTLTTIMDDVNVVQDNVPEAGKTDDNRPTISGTASTDAKYVNVYDTFAGAKLFLGTATVNSTTGQWSLTPSQGLSIGLQSITAEAVDGAGNVSGATPARTFTVIADAPLSAAITSVVDNLAPVTGFVPKDGVTNDTTPTVTGTAPAGSLVKIYDGTNPNPIASVIAGGNGAWSVIAPISTEGSHPLTAEATLNGVTTPRTDVYNLILDTVAPTQPVITDYFDNIGSATGNIGFNTTTDDARPEINGTGEIGSTVEVFLGTKSLGTATVVANPANPNQGIWTLALSQDLPAGVNTFTAKATDKAGNTSLPSAAVQLTVDTSNTVVTIDDAVDNQPAVIGTILNGGVTNDKTPMLEGRAPANTLVTISEGGVAIGSVTSDNSGKWTFTPTNAAEGTHTYTASATNAAGTPGTAKFTLVVDTAAPAITIDTVNDDVGAVTGVVAEGARIDDTTPTIKGRAEPFSIVTVTDLTTNTVLGTVQTGSDGKWSITPVGSMAQGLHKVSATATDASGNTGTANEQPSFIIDTTAPNTPTVELLTDANNDGFLNAAELNGASTVAVKISLPSGTLVGDKIVVTNGSVSPITLTAADIQAGYVITSAPKPAEGSTLTVTAALVDGAGNTGPSGSDSAKIDTSAPTLVLTTIADDVGAPQNNIPQAGVTDDNHPTISGTASTDAKYVNVYDTVNGVRTLLGTAAVDSTTGNWTLTPAQGIANGLHSITAAAVDSAGNQSADTTPARTFSVATDAPAAAAITNVADNFDPVTGNVPKDGVTNDTTPTVSGTAAPGSTVVVFDNGTRVPVTVTADKDGNWSLDVPISGQGQHAFTAQATLNGVQTPVTGPYNIILDTVAAGTPTIDSFTDNVGPIVNPALPSGSLTDDARPEINGRGEAGTTVEVFLGTKSLGTAVVGSDSKWTLALSQDLPAGTSEFVARATDKAGNVSLDSNKATLTLDTSGVLVTIDTALDDKAAITGNVLNGGVTNDDTPTLQGRATANAVVTITDTVNGVTTSTTVTASNAGTWTYTPASSADGTHAYTASVTNPTTGVKSTANYSLVIDTQAPLTSGVTIDTISDDVGSITGTVAEGARTDDTNPTFTGRAEALSIVTLTDKTTGFVLGTVQTNANGFWTITPVATLGQGVHQVVAVATDGAGNTSGESNKPSFIIDTTPPGPLDTQLTIGSVTADNVLTAAEAGSPVSISGTVTGEFKDTDQVVLVINNQTYRANLTRTGTNTASYIVAVAGSDLLADGDKTIDGSIRATDGAGNQGTITATHAYLVDNNNAPVPTTTEIVQSALNVDITRPTLNITDDTIFTTDVLKNSKVKYTFNFSTPIIPGTFTLADVQIANGTLVAGSFKQVDAKTWEVEVNSPTTGSGITSIFVDDGSYVGTNSVPGVGSIHTQAFGPQSLSLGGDATRNALTGTDTDDYILGGAGNDIMKGGAGDDKFKLENGFADIGTGALYGPNLQTGWIPVDYNGDTVPPDTASLPGNVIFNGGNRNPGDYAQTNTYTTIPGGTLVIAWANGVIGATRGSHSYQVQIYDAVTGALLVAQNYNCTGSAAPGSYGGGATYALAFSPPSGTAYVRFWNFGGDTLNSDLVIFGVTTQNVLTPEIIDGGTQGATGDTIDASTMTQGVQVLFSAEGTGKIYTNVDYTKLDISNANFTNIEKVKLGSGNDVIAITNANLPSLTAAGSQVFLDGGKGVNSLSMNDVNMNLDLTNINVAERLHNFSNVYIGPGGTLKANLANVLNMSGATDVAGTTVDESHMLVVYGAPANNGVPSSTLSLSQLSGWKVVGTKNGALLSALYPDPGYVWSVHNTSAYTYTQYELNGATLWVENTVAVVDGVSTTPVPSLTTNAVTVESLFGSTFTDANAGQTFKGIAITNAGSAADLASKGQYQISHDGGVTWQNLGSGLTDGQAIYAAKTDLIRFKTVAGNELVSEQDLVARLIDSSGNTNTANLVAGQTVDASKAGFTEAFSDSKVTLKAGNTVLAPKNVANDIDNLVTPLALDLNGDGIQTTDLAHGTVYDLAATGQAKQSAWVEKHDGFLVRDINHDGKINDGSEMFGAGTTLANGTKAKDGYQALGTLDSNTDGIIDAKDAAFNELQVWVDANGDGITEVGELHSLKDLGISSLSLAAQKSDAMQNGNAIGLVSSYTSTDGSTHQMADVWLQTANSLDKALANTKYLATVDTTKAGTHSLTLNLNDVLHMTGDTAGTATDSHVLVVNGAQGDSVQLVDSSTWTKVGSQSGVNLAAVLGEGHDVVANHMYTQYSHGNTQLFVDETLNRSMQTV